ncbi:MAG: metallophosphoesterase [Planctomycetes bacterium]|nr:metallophosphoesterase [Planctomycetota bacterium]
MTGRRQHEGSSTERSGPRHFAAVGDVHGHMHAMVGQVQAAAQKAGVEIDFVLQVGDFEAHRHEEDLETMCSPAKYRKLGEFAHYHSGQATFPWPIHFIGGNHEPYGFLDRLKAGQAAENCFFLGRVASVEIQGLRVVGLSGIERARCLGGRPPIGGKGTKNYVGFTEDEVLQAASAGPADVLLLHDWPAGVVDPLDAEQFRYGHRAGGVDSIGNASARLVVDELRPNWVLCGHMHRSYRTEIRHRDGSRTSFAGLAKVGTPAAVAIFAVEEGRIVEVTKAQAAGNALP